MIDNKLGFTAQNWAAINIVKARLPFVRLILSKHRIAKIEISRFGLELSNSKHSQNCSTHL